MSKTNNSPIGVFDSGIGGLTCLKSLEKHFPNENFLYLGDTARCPYGIRSQKDLEKIVEENIYWLEEQCVKMIVIACNTATANSYHIDSYLPIIRIIQPTCEKINRSRGRTVILATNYTIKSKSYEKFLKEKCDGISCSEWVDIIEAAETKTKKSKESVMRLLSPIKGKVENLVLGCTHFGLIEEEIREFLGEGINVINSSYCVVDEIKETLRKIGVNRQRKGRTRICVTGEPEKMNIGWFSKEKLDIRKVSLRGE